MSSGITVEYILRERVAVIRFGFCERNTFDLSRVSALLGAVDDAVQRASVRVVVFASARQGYFSDGYSIDDLFGPRLRKQLRQGDFQAHEQVQNVYRRLIDTPIPTVSFVDGVCRGAGLEWALCCDFILATTQSSFAFHEIRLGIVPGLGGFHLLAMRVPAALATRIIFTAESLDAKQAHAAGLVDALADDMDGAIANFVEQIARRPRAGLVRMKSLTDGRERKLSALHACQDAFRDAIKERVSRGIEGS